MFKLQKNLIYYFCLACTILFLATFVPFFRPLALNILKLPLDLFMSTGREVRAVLLYHHNYAENARLINETDLLKNKLNTLNELYLENKRLKALLVFKQNTPYKVVAAKVIGRSADNWSSVLIIDKGSAQGIKRGDVVINYFGLIGRVSEAGQYVAKIILINDTNLSVSCLNQRSRQEGLVCGTLGNNLIMKYLPKDADVGVSDTVITSGLTGIFPKGIVVGKITAYGEEFSGLSRYAVIKPAVDLSAIEEVLIIIR